MNTDIPTLHQYCGISRQTPSALSKPSLEKVADVFEQDRGPHFGGKNGNIGLRGRAPEKRTCPRDVHEHVCTTVDLKSGMLNDVETVSITEDAINYCEKHDVLEIQKKRYAFRHNLVPEDDAVAAGPAEELPVPSYGVPPSFVVRNELIEHIRRNSSVLNPEPVPLSIANVKQFTEPSPLEDDYSDMPPLEDAPPLEDEGIWRRIVVVPFVSQYSGSEMEEVD